MNKAERAAIVFKILEKNYPKTPVPLRHTNNYTLLIAVLLSAQCTDERVNQITPKLFALADNPKDMSGWLRNKREAISFEKEAEKYAQKNWKKWYNTFKKEGLI